MPKQDPTPLPYGPLQYYQSHFIVKIDSEENDNVLARCEPVTKGHFGSKRVVDIKWTGADKFAEVLRADARLTEMLKEVMLREGEIRVDPLGDHIRIYGKWIHEDAFAFNQTMFEIADRIAGHIKTRLRARRNALTIARRCSYLLLEMKLPLIVLEKLQFCGKAVVSQAWLEV